MAPLLSGGLGRAHVAGESGVVRTGVGPYLAGPGLDDRETGPVTVPVHDIRAPLAGRVAGDDRHVHGRRICPEREAVDRHVPRRSHISARRWVPLAVGDRPLVEADSGTVDLSRVVA